MAQITGIFAASHTPVMLNFPQAIPDALRNDIFEAFGDIGRAISNARPQALVVISDDHVHNFFLNNLPSLCIGAAEKYPTPVEHWLKAEKRVLPGDAALGAYLLQHAMANDFDPSLSMELTLDHGILTPLELGGVPASIPIVPILVNCVQPPLPSMARCYAFGRWLGQALREYTGIERVCILATGGLSHDLATPRMGMLNEDFDREFLARLQAGDADGAISYARDHVHLAGNGAEEVRMWLVAMGAAGATPFVPRLYEPVADWYTGIGLGHWAC
jgi:aromatic ring-opening dioxygenase catalytic subunit (LigB family)